MVTKIDLLYTKHWEVLFWNARKKGDDLKQFHVDLAYGTEIYRTNDFSYS